MKFLPANTLAHFAAAPQGQALDLSHLPVAVFSAATREYRAAHSEVPPEDEAFTFYALNHCAALVRKRFTLHEPLPAWALSVLQAYALASEEQGKRMLHYILSITTREMRHLKVPSGPALNIPHQKFWDKMGTQFGPEMVTFIQKIQQHPNEMAAVKVYTDQPPPTTVGQYLGALAYAFHQVGHGEWHGSYGGHPWGNVADAAHQMVTGKLSLAMLVDMGYALAHNGGPIFNKGMLYSHWLQQNMPPLYTILDVQASGQIPDLLLDPTNWGVKKPAQALALVQQVAQALTKPEDQFKGFVNWQAVKRVADGQEQKNYYDAYKAKQALTHPVSVEPVLATVGGKPVKITGEWTVFPGQTVQVYERVA